MEIQFKKREAGRASLRGLRKEGHIPVICYGAREAADMYSVSARTLQDAIHSDETIHRTVGDLSDKQVMVQEIQRDPITHDITHADFMLVDAFHEVEHEVPIHLTGEAPVLKKGGIIDSPLHTLHIKALPKNMPGHLDVSIETLEEVGDRILASSVTLPSGVSLVTAEDTPVVIALEQEKEEDESEGAEGEGSDDEQPKES